MATVSTLVSVDGTAVGDYGDVVTQKYQVIYDAAQSNFYSALIAAQTAATITPVPARRSIYAGTSSVFLYAQSIHGQPTSIARTAWDWTVTYTPPPPGEQGPGGPFGFDNPLDRPPVYNVEYLDREYVIWNAKNVAALSHGDGKGGNRAASTLGPIVNAAGKRPDEGLVDTERLEVLVIRRNYASLAQIVSRNRAFKRTTNSDGLVGYSARELKYLLTASEGIHFENGIEFWPGVTTVLAEDSTDLTLDNVGYDYWDAVASNWVRSKDKDGHDTAEPINLKLDGDKGGDNTTTITYRHLTETAYASLIT